MSAPGVGAGAAGSVKFSELPEDVAADLSLASGFVTLVVDGAGVEVGATTGGVGLGLVAVVLSFGFFDL